MNPLARIRGKQARSSGELGEDLTRKALASVGYTFIERVHTAWVVVRRVGPKTKKSRIVSAFPAEKVSGDFRAVDPKTGRSVLCEAKFDGGDRVVYSDLEKHQVKALDDHFNAGGESILSVVINNRAWLLRWPIADFKPGTSIRLQDGELIIGKGKS